MIARFGEALTALLRRVLPDPFLFALALTLVTIALAALLTDASPRDIVLAWSHKPGWDAAFWSFLKFGMQMCLVLVTGHALAEAPAVKRALRRVASIPRTTQGAAALVCAVAMGTALLNWGLAIVVGAVLARETAWAGRRRGLAFHYPILGAAGYMGLMNWHGGLSGSGPLDLAARAQNAVPITDTLLLPANVGLNLALLVATPLVFWLMAPRDPAKCEPIALPEPEPAQRPAPRTPAERIESSPFFTLIFVAMAGAALWWGFREKGFAFVDLFAVPFVFLFAGLLLHWRPVSYANAINEAAAGCGGIILQFPFYAGIAGIMTATGLGREIAAGFTALAGGSRVAFGCWTFVAACLINMFIPSGGGQWKVQGAFAVQAGLALPKPVGENLTCMFIAYGDELTNMLQPFWALALLGITGLRANQIMGYSASAMLLVFPIYLVAVALMAG